MRPYPKDLGRLGLLALALAAAAVPAACDDDDVTGPDPGDSPLLGQDLDQVDRFGFAAINTAFVSADADKDAFNTADPAQDAQFIPVAAGVIATRYGVPQDDATALADLVLPDIQPLGDLSGALFAGRRLTDDVIDIELGVLFGPDGISSLAPAPALASDNVDANDRPFLGSFPYLAEPHTS